VRSSDIATRCREVALRVEISGEWGELGDTLRLAAAEIERLRRAKKSWERESQAHAAEAERLRLLPGEVEALIVASIELQALHGFETNHSEAIRNLIARNGGAE